MEVVKNRRKDVIKEFVSDINEWIQLTNINFPKQKNYTLDILMNLKKKWNEKLL